MSIVEQQYVRAFLRGQSCWADKQALCTEDSAHMYFYTDSIAWWLGVRLCLEQR